MAFLFSHIAEIEERIKEYFKEVVNIGAAVAALIIIPGALVFSIALEWWILGGVKK